MKIITLILSKANVNEPLAKDKLVAELVCQTAFAGGMDRHFWGASSDNFPPQMMSGLLSSCNRLLFCSKFHHLQFLMSPC